MLDNLIVKVATSLMNSETRKEDLFMESVMFVTSFMGWVL